MKRFRRWAFTGIAVLSLLLCALTIAELARSFWVSGALVRFRYLPPDLSVATPDFQPAANQEFTDISILRGELVVGRSVRPVGYSGRDEHWSWINVPTSLLVRGPSLLSRLGFELSIQTSKDYPGAWSVRMLFPLWGIALLTATTPICWIVRLSRRPAQAGVCRICGYDLRATPDRCPECGTIPSHKKVISN
jgi:hypothetical protein